MILISVLAGWATLCASARLAPPEDRLAVVVTLGCASPLWFYAVSGWHHAAGMAFGTAAFVGAFGRNAGRTAFLAGQSALQTPDAANAELPVLHPMTWRERHQTVVQYWMFGYGNDTTLAAFSAGLAVALQRPRTWSSRSSAWIRPGGRDSAPGCCSRCSRSDELHTAQLLFPLYYRKIVFLADSPPSGAALDAMLAAERVPGALVVSRSLEPGVVLPAMRKKATERVGRMTITHWVR